MSFKERRINNSKSTALKLEKELEKKKRDLEKMAGLDKKLPVELKQFKTKIRDMKSEMKAFKSPEELEQEAKVKKAELSQQKISTSKEREMLKLRVSRVGHDLDDMKRRLAKEGKKLETHETHLRSRMQSAFALSDFITTKKRESDWEGLASQTRDLTAEINSLNLSASKST